MTGKAGKKKNAIMIVVDTLRYDHLGYAGYEPSPSPTMDKLFANGVTMTNGFASGCPTLMALPGLFTSTLPLDRGGYDLGICNRDVSFVEILNREGYRTYGNFVNLIPYGYDRGFDKFSVTFPVSDSILAGVFYPVAYLINDYLKRRISIDRCVEVLEPFLSRGFQAIKQFCSEKEIEMSLGNEMQSLVLHDAIWNYAEIHGLACEEEALFISDPERYIKKIVRKKALSTVLHRIFKTDTQINNKLIRAILARDSSVTKQFDRRNEEMVSLLGSMGIDCETNSKLTDKAASARFIVNNIVSWIDRQPETPFFAYAHFFEAHPPCNFFSHDMWQGADARAEELAILEDVYHTVKDRKSAYSQKDLRYLFSVRYIDEQIKNLLTALEKRNILNDTVIIITSDHGTNYPGIPYREKCHVVEDFYDEIYRVPISFFNKDLQAKQVTGLCSAIDIAPALLDILGLSIPSCFKGESLVSEGFAGRDYLIMEHMGRGLCDHLRQSILVCVRSKDYKLVYETPPGSAMGVGFIREVYDLGNDPYEQNNIAQSATRSDEIRKLTAIAEQRVKEIMHDKQIYSLSEKSTRCTAH